MKLVLSGLPHTWVLDLDGTIVVHNVYKMYGEDVFLDGAKEFLCSIPEDDMIVFLTSRKKEYANRTEEFLNKNGIRYNAIVYEAPYGERILVNDNKPSGLKMAYAVCMERDAKNELSVEFDDRL